MAPWVNLLIVLVIGIVAGLIYDRLAGPGWLTRQVAGSRRSIVTSSLVGIAGSFIGFHVAGLLRLTIGGYGGYVGAWGGGPGGFWGWGVGQRPFGPRPGLCRWAARPAFV